MLATAPGVYKLFMEGGDNVPYVGPTQKKIKNESAEKATYLFQSPGTQCLQARRCASTG